MSLQMHAAAAEQPACGGSWCQIRPHASALRAGHCHGSAGMLRCSSDGRHARNLQCDNLHLITSSDSRRLGGIFDSLSAMQFCPVRCGLQSCGSSAFVMTNAVQCSTQLVAVGQEGLCCIAGDGVTADPFVSTALAEAVREGALLWTLPWVTSYAAISAARGTCSLPLPVQAQLAQIRCALHKSTALVPQILPRALSLVELC